MLTMETIVIPVRASITHAEAQRLSQTAETSHAERVILDLRKTIDATTAGFARLVLLRSKLLREGRNVVLCGLTGQPAKLFEVHRLETVLPRVEELPPNSLIHAEPPPTWRVPAFALCLR